MIYEGTGVSMGIAIGEIYLYQPSVTPVTKAISQKTLDQELLWYAALKKKAATELRSVRDRLSEVNQSEAAIFGAHIEILDDEAIDEEIRYGICREHWSSEWAIEKIYTKYTTLLAKSNNPLMRERTEDVTDVKNRLLRICFGTPQCDLSELNRPVIVAAHDLLPSDTATMNRRNVLGILTETGGITSHSAIIAKSEGIPAVLGIPSLMGSLVMGQNVILDALDGVLITDPDDEQNRFYRKKGRAYLASAVEASQYLDRNPLTKDGVRVEVGLNVGAISPQALEGSLHTDFVGLLRTEFLYMNSDHLPTEEEQLLAYKKVLLEYGARPVVLRTLDIGGDKTLPYFPLPNEQNPFLGRRALRLCFNHPEVFRTQLRAALRASIHGNLWIMLPMVGIIDDVRRSRVFLNETMQELERSGVPFCRQVKLGIMIEIPSIALMADMVAKEVDFASFGTNDLCQYLMAADRMNPDVAEYYQPYNPALFRLIGSVTEQFDAAQKPICVCGELGGDPLVAPVLVGLGLRKLSMSLSSVAAVKKALSRHTIAQMQRMARDVNGFSSAREVEYYLKEHEKQT